MSLEGGQFKQRVLSAKPTGFNQTLIRPLSGIPSNSFSRTELIQHVYTMQSQILPLRTASAKAITNRALLGLQKSKKIVVKQSRKKQEMQQEILKLKQTINHLTDQLCQQKGKTQSMRKKGNKLSKMLSIQFQNENHWNSSAQNSHLVAGIKNTYDSLKEKYEMLQQEHSLLLKRETITKELEYITYIDALEKENKALSMRLVRISESTVGVHQKEAADYIIGQLQTDCQDIAEKYKDLQGRYQMCMETLKDRNKKIQFLQKIILQKDNALHMAQRQTKKLKQETYSLRQINEHLQYNIKEQFQTQQRYIKGLQAKIQEQKEYHQQNVFGHLASKQATITELQKEISYLKQIINEMRRTNSELNNLQQQNRSKSNNNRSEVLVLEPKKEIIPPVTNKNNNSQCQINYIGQHYMTVDQHSARNEPFSGLFVNGKRIPQKADIKYHEHAQKKRKITLGQVSELVDLIILKLVRNNFPFAKVKTLFEVSTHNRKGEWEQEYINMRQVNHILKFPPFSLPPDKAELLARYLIEDVQDEFVYCDDFNQNTRQIVKSILKALLKDYPVCMANSHLESDVKKFMQNYQVNLKSALTKIEPSGVISKKKFVQTLVNLGMQCSQDMEYVLLSRMIENANSINQLNYKALFN